MPGGNKTEKLGVITQKFNSLSDIKMHNQLLIRH